MKTTWFVEVFLNTLGLLTRVTIVGVLVLTSISGNASVNESFPITNELEMGRADQTYRGVGQQGLISNSSWCERDVVCSPEGDGWGNQIRAVGRLTIQGQNESCSGTLLNNTKFRDPQYFHKPYFLTAYHCKTSIPGFDPNNIEIAWNFQSAICRPNVDGRTDAPEVGQRILTGADIRAEWPDSDFMLLELKTPPPVSAYYAGWDPNDITVPTGAVGIHHPKGDVKAISTSHHSLIKTGYPNNTPSETYWLVQWDAAAAAGVTELGSSGSCLFDSINKRCIGQLRDGKEIRCAKTDRSSWYGRLSKSWVGGGTDGTGLRHWLDPLNSNPPSGIDGDPHITTVDGIHYNFQGAGEYITLRNADGLEIQTRQAPIATTFTPGADPYDGVATCVSLNSAVALRVGKHRVTYQPNISGVPDPTGLQLRVDGKLTTLGPHQALDLEGGGRISKTSATGDLKIDFPNSSALFITPGWWESQQKWYLNVDFLPPRPAVDGIGGGIVVEEALATSDNTPSNMGLMGTIAKGSWLPALPDGSSLGRMPDSLHQRYLDLYEKFGRAWRVTDDTSLFDYAKGTSTTTFTFDDWPRENPSTPTSCYIPGTPVARPVDLNVAQRHCGRIVDKNRKSDCIFDVMVTGYPGFAETYLKTEQIHPGATEIIVKDDKDPTHAGEIVTFTATVRRTDSIGTGSPVGKVQFILDGKKIGNPIQLDSNGSAVWSTSTLSIGKHQITAKHLIRNFGHIIPASISAVENHQVKPRIPLFWLLIVLIILLILVVWWYRGKKN